MKSVKSLELIKSKIDKSINSIELVNLVESLTSVE